jgi:hypothetical protein
MLISDNEAFFLEVGRGEGNPNLNKERDFFFSLK